MKKFVFVLFIVTLVFVVCGGDSAPVDNPEVGETAPTAVPPSPQPAEPSPEPTDLLEPTATPEPALITDAPDMVGIWLGTVAGEKGYVMYTDDGRYTVALVEADLGTAPRVSGEYWFEDGKIHLRDLENAGHWAVCDAETVGVYEAVVLEDGKVQFQTVEDGCDVGGFTRNYIFANMTQERIGDPVPIAAPEAETEPNPELAAALQAVTILKLVEQGNHNFVFDEWGIPDLGEVQGHGGLFNSQAFYWPEQNVIIVGTLNSNEPQFGYVGLLIDALSAVQAMAE